jgi:hypothetical protein
MAALSTALRIRNWTRTSKSFTSIWGFSNARRFRRVRQIGKKEDTDETPYKLGGVDSRFGLRLGAGTTG